MRKFASLFAAGALAVTIGVFGFSHGHHHFPHGGCIAIDPVAGQPGGVICAPFHGHPHDGQGKETADTGGPGV